MKTSSAAAALPEATSADQAAARLSELFEEHGRMVYGLCRVLLRDPVEAEDAAQEAFLSAQRSLLAGNEPREPAAWLAAIARNECRARIRERMRAPLSLVDDSLHESSELSHVADQREEVQALCEAMAELPAQQRQAIVLREIYGLSYEEACAALGVSLAALKSLLFRARTGLQEQLQPARVALGAFSLPPSLRHAIAEQVPGFSTAAPVSGGGAGVIAALVAKLAAAPVAAKVATATVAATVVTAGAVATPPAVEALSEEPSRAAVPAVYEFGPTVSIAASEGDVSAAASTAASPPYASEARWHAATEDAPEGDWLGQETTDDPGGETYEEEYAGEEVVDEAPAEESPAEPDPYAEDPAWYEEPSSNEDPSWYEDPASYEELPVAEEPSFYEDANAHGDSADGATYDLWRTELEAHANDDPAP